MQVLAMVSCCSWGRCGDELCRGGLGSGQAQPLRDKTMDVAMGGHSVGMCAGNKAVPRCMPLGCWQAQRS
jgi:hypothetical protein